MVVNLDAEPREQTGKSDNRKLRDDGKIPAVVYGREIETENLKVPGDSIRNLLKSGAINNVLVELSVDGETDSRNVLIKDVDMHPVNSTLRHVDFHQVSPTDEVQVKVPIKLTGESVGVEREGGIIDQPIRIVEIECNADDIPEAIDVDISEMEIGDAVFVEDLDISDGARVLEDDERTVVTIQPPKEFELEPTTPAEEEEIEEAVEEALEEAAEGEEAEGEEVEEGEAVEGEDVEAEQAAPEEEPEL